MNSLLVMLGGAVGALARYQFGRLALAGFGPGFPWGTLGVNLIGGLAMGLLAGSLARFSTGSGESLRLLLGVGVLGGFTTFSAFSLDTMLMLERGEIASALFYVAVSVGGSVLALFCGLFLIRTIA
ncbi:fluoride efflux transporter CrcB [Sphingobium subterraneum]|uniref:Fluoride-specific ion channel FluC n=1 Tax=Sphingobium subterraneum TaxID=627688 RepID=A0A841J2X0_9SPHN|nr:fluoride efflux transporter CrcB [Sphingobium subterraneum]MBB6123876.1 CrcB protein [Sphingobium subterraneum]